MLANGRRLVTKLWQASRFAQSRLQDLDSTTLGTLPTALLPTDRWLLSRLVRTISSATAALEHEDFAAARQETERFFWSDLCDNYLELIKGRLYSDESSAERHAAQWTLYHALLAVLKLLAPYLPFVTEEIYQHIFAAYEGIMSIHIAIWPEPRHSWIDESAEATGQAILNILSRVRRYKAEHGLSVGSLLPHLHITAATQAELEQLQAAAIDLRSATRAQALSFVLAQAGKSLKEEEKAEELFLR
jgi:valyl-tRNA synthetase